MNRLQVANAIMTWVGATAVAVGLILMVTVQNDGATSTFTPGSIADRPAKEIVMEPEDHAAFPQCVDMRDWARGRVPARVLVVRSNGDRAVMGLDVAFAVVKESQADASLRLWVIGACPA